MEGQGAECGIAARAAAANEGLAAVDQALCGEVLDGRAGICHIAFAPAQVQRLAIGAAVSGAAAVVQVGNRKASLGPVLDARVKHRVARGSRAAVDEYHQWRRALRTRWRVEEAMGNLTAAVVVDRLGSADAVVW